MRIAIYDAWLHTLGGGEKHALTAAAALAELHEVHVLCHSPISKLQLETATDLPLHNIHISNAPLLPQDALLQSLTSYDLFINATHESMLPNPCRHGIRLLFFPPRPPPRSVRLLQLASNWTGRRLGLPRYGAGFYGPERIGRGWYRATGRRAVIQVQPGVAGSLGMMAANPSRRPRHLVISHGGITVFEADIPPTAGHFIRVGPILLRRTADADPGLLLEVETAMDDLQSSPSETREIGLLIADPKCGIPWEFPLRMLTHRVFPRLGEAIERQNSHGGRAALATYDVIVANSAYTGRWLRRWWELPSRIIYPPVDLIGNSNSAEAKRPEILSVGRFFIGGHNKKHDLMVNAFRAMIDAGLQGWRLRLLGGIGHRAVDRAYVMRVRGLAAGLPVDIETDVEADVLRDAYQRASIYWHAAGYRQNPVRDPGAFEHFGVAAVEAMSAGAVPVVFDGGGLRETVEDGRSGYLWRSISEFRACTWKLIRDAGRRQHMAQAAAERSNSFSGERFRREFLAIVKSLA